MKTKKIEKVSLIYLISFVVIFASALYLSFIWVQSILWIWGVFLCVTYILLYCRYIHIRNLLLLDFEEYLQIKISKRDWSDYLEFPLKEDIEKWIREYAIYNNVYINLPKKIWDRMMVDHLDARIEDVLKRLVISIIGVERGLSLYDLYNFPTIDSLYVNTGNTTKESQEMGAYIENLPVKSLICYLEMPIQLTSVVLYRLLIRKDEVGNFATVCKALMDANCEVDFSEEIIDALIAETSKSVPVGFPQRFLSYLVDQDYKSHPHFKEVTSIRRKVLAWWLKQKSKDLDFFDYWPSLDQEEINRIKKAIPPKLASKVFERMEVWSELSDPKLRGLFLRYAEHPEKIKDRAGFLDVIFHRFLS